VSDLDLKHSFIVVLPSPCDHDTLQIYSYFLTVTLIFDTVHALIPNDLNLWPLQVCSYLYLVELSFPCVSATSVL
jgi:hypothetical protein